MSRRGLVALALAAALELLVVLVANTTDMPASVFYGVSVVVLVVAVVVLVPWIEPPRD